MIDWRWLIPLALVAGASIGWFLCQQRMRALCVRCQRALKMDEDEWEGAALVDRGTIPPPSLPLPSSAEAQELARLRELVPSPGLVRRMADDADHMGDRYATEASLGVPGAAENERQSRIDDKTARALAARIEAEGAGAESVAAGEGE